MLVVAATPAQLFLWSREVTTGHAAFDVDAEVLSAIDLRQESWLAAVAQWGR
jgi:hypothetical protein